MLAKFLPPSLYMHISVLVATAPCGNIKWVKKGGIIVQPLRDLDSHLEFADELLHSGASLFDARSIGISSRTSDSGIKLVVQQLFQCVLIARPRSGRRTEGCTTARSRSP